MPNLFRRLSPVQTLVLGFAVIVLVSASLLSMPFSSSRGVWQPFVDCVFMTSSAISTTGLVVADIGKDYSLVGQVIMLFVIQIGGIGYMCFVPLVVSGLGGKMGIGTRMVLRESMARPGWLDMAKFARVIILATLGIEAVSAAALTLEGLRWMPVGKAIYAGVFHSVNAFCTAGMSIWTDNLTIYRHSVPMHLVLILTMLAGGIGFFVIYDLYRYAKKLLLREYPRTLSTHSKVALSVTGVVVGLGAVVYLVAGLRSPGTPALNRAMDALFQSVSASTTTGFNTIDVGGLGTAALFALIVLMFIGASPNSTGGGIKTTTLGTMLASLRALLSGRTDVTLFKRRILPHVATTAFALTLAAALWTAAATAVIMLVEPLRFDQVFFEVVSAFGNVGLSMGITTKLSEVSRIVLSLTMFFGRVGPLAIGFSLFGRRERPAHHYAEDDVFVG
jgi:trk system potassium uptake protein TrkH